VTRIFDLNNTFWRVISAVADLIGLSVLWLVCCIPVVTIGPATAALYYAVTKCVRRLEGGVCRSFFHSFGQNWRQGVPATLLVLPLVALTVLGWWFVFSVGANRPWGLGALLGYGILTALPMGMVLYLFPVQARFEYTMGGLFRAALHLSMGHLLRTLLLRVTSAVTAYISVALLLPAFILPAVCMLVYSLVLEGVFRAFSPELAAEAAEEARLKLEQE